jgi:hypothetical protein
MNDIGAGHNHPPFDPKEIVNIEILAAQLRDTYSHLFKEQAALVTAAEKWKADHPHGITDDDDQGRSTEQVAQLKTVLEAYHGKPASVHTIAKEPFLHGGRIVDTVLNAELAGPIRQAITDLMAPMQAYAQAKLRKAQEEAAAAAAKAQREADAALARHESDPMAALQAEQDAMDKAADAAQPVGPQSQVRGDLGGMSSLRGKWVVKVTDVTKIPVQYLMPNMAVLEAVMNASKDKKSGRPTAQVNGVEWEFETKLAIRK